jgi:hypothetical protein
MMNKSLRGRRLESSDAIDKPQIWFPTRGGSRESGTHAAVAAKKEPPFPAAFDSR